MVGSGQFLRSRCKLLTHDHMFVRFVIFVLLGVCACWSTYASLGYAWQLSFEMSVEKRSAIEWLRRVTEGLALCAWAGLVVMVWNMFSYLAKNRSRSARKASVKN